MIQRPVQWYNALRNVATGDPLRIVAQLTATRWLSPSKPVATSFRLFDSTDQNWPTDYHTLHRRYTRRCNAVSAFSPVIGYMLPTTILIATLVVLAREKVHNMTAHCNVIRTTSEYCIIIAVLRYLLTCPYVQLLAGSPLFKCSPFPRRDFPFCRAYIYIYTTRTNI